MSDVPLTREQKVFWKLMGIQPVGLTMKMTRLASIQTAANMKIVRSNTD